MAQTELGKVSAAIYGEVAPVDTSFLWGKQLDAIGNPNLVQFFYHDGTNWLPLKGSDHFKDPVLGQVATPPVSPSNNDRYLVSASGTTGDFIGHENTIAVWDTNTTAWLFTSVSAGNYLYKSDDEAYVLFNGTLWVTQSKTTQEYFDIEGGTGVKLKSAGGGLEVRDLSDTIYLPITVSELTITGPNSFWKNGGSTILADASNVLIDVRDETNSMRILEKSGVIGLELKAHATLAGGAIIGDSSGLGIYFDPNNVFTNGAGYYIDDKRIGGGGLQNKADYSADFTARHLIDKGFADATYAPIATATDYWDKTDATILNYSASGAASFTVVDGITNAIDITGQDTAETFDFITANVLDTDRLSSGEANFLKFQNDGVDVFKIDIDGNINMPSPGNLMFDDTGFSENSNILNIIISGSPKFNFATNYFDANFTSGASMYNQGASSTVPSLIPYRGTAGANKDTGVGGTGTTLSLITGGLEALNVDSSQNITLPTGSLTLTNDINVGGFRIDYVGSSEVDLLFIGNTGKTGYYAGQLKNYAALELYGPTSASTTGVLLTGGTLLDDRATKDTIILGQTPWVSSTVNLDGSNVIIDGGALLGAGTDGNVLLSTNQGLTIIGDTTNQDTTSILQVSPNIDSDIILGKARIDSRSANAAYFSLADNTTVNNYNVLFAAGSIFINSVGLTKTIDFRHDHTNLLWQITTDGDLIASAGKNLNLSDTSAIQINSIDAMTFSATQDVTIANILTLGSKVDPDPTGVNGMIYYNSTNNKFRAFENSVWVDMIGGGGGSSVGSNNEIQTSDGSGAFVASKMFFDELTGNMILGDSGLAGTLRQILPEGSQTNIGIELKTKGTGGVSFTRSFDDEELFRISNGTAMFRDMAGGISQDTNYFSVVYDGSVLKFRGETGTSDYVGITKTSIDGLSTGAGLTIGVSATSKLGFYGASVAVQPVHIADATDAASVITQLNLLLAQMATLGLQASS